MPLKLEPVFFSLFVKLDYFLACFNNERACLLAHKADRICKYTAEF